MSTDFSSARALEFRRKDEIDKRERNVSNGNVPICGPYRRDAELYDHFCTDPSPDGGDAKTDQGSAQASPAGRKDPTDQKGPRFERTECHVVDGFDSPWAGQFHSCH